jgi:hypothetical protein
MKIKNSITLSILLIATSYANAQKIKETEVPAAVKSSFAKLYPNSKVEKWEKENGNYEAGFHINKVETSVLLDVNGTLKETETEIAVSVLPKPVSEYISKNVPGKKIKEASKITDVKGVITYEAEVDEVDYVFDSNGSFIKKVVEAQDGKKD